MTTQSWLWLVVCCRIQEINIFTFNEIYLYSRHHFNANANGRNNSQHCCLLLGVFGQQCCVRLHGPKSLTGFKLYAKIANNVVVPCKRTQYVGPNNVACCLPTMLRSFAWTFTSSNCIFMQLQGIVYIQLQGNDIVTNSYKNIFIQGNYSRSRNLYINLKEIIFIQGNYIHWRNVEGSGL